MAVKHVAVRANQLLASMKVTRTNQIAPRTAMNLEKLISSSCVAEWASVTTVFGKMELESVDLVVNKC